MDRDAIWAFMERMTGFASGFVTIGMLALADRTGLLPAMKGAAPADARSVAERAGISERYAIELLEGLAVAGVLDHHPDDDTFSLPDERAAVVADDFSPYALTGYLDMLPALVDRLPSLTAAVESGGGVPADEYDERAVIGIDRANSPGTRILLTRRWLTTMPDVVECLEAGGRIVDVGCGSGTAAITMAKAYPAATVVGIDVDERALERARAKKSTDGVSNLEFVNGDASAIDGEFDLVTALDVVHDLAEPLVTLRAIRSSLADHGVLMMMEPRTSAHLSDDIGEDRAALVYGLSVLYCLPQSLADDGAGLGAAWGPVAAEQACREAGFRSFEPLPIENPFSVFYRVAG